MRFDDTLETVLAADLGTPFGLQSAWRQLVDLIGRRRVPADARALRILRAIRDEVPASVRAASARGLEHADPPPPLVRLFATDELPIALAVLRSARMPSAEWIQLLPDLAPGGRAVLRNRRDLSPVVRRALESYGPIDFVLRDETVKEVEEAIETPVESPAVEEVVAVVAIVVAEDPIAVPEPESPMADPSVEVAAAPEAEAPVRQLPPEQIVDWSAVLETPAFTPAPRVAIAETPPATASIAEVPVVEAAPPSAPAETPAEDFTFVALAGFAASLPNATIVAHAPVQSGTVEASAPAEAIAEPIGPAQETAMEQGDSLSVAAPGTLIEPVAGLEGAEAEDGTFPIAEVVARIDAFWRNREEAGAENAARAPVRAEDFRFETDAMGVIRWVEGVSRAPIVGLSLDLQGSASGGSQIDGVAAGAFRRRAGFSNARLLIDGESDAAGAWLISAIPVFDPANGRFTGYRGTARRPRADERAEPARPAATPADSLRQLVHELRTPTNAIAGFAEMIETQMLGPVADPYRDRAHMIRSQAKELLGAIDDLDLAARIDSAALSLVPGRVTLRPVLAGIADDLAPLAALRGSAIALPIDDLAVTGDRRAVERLLARLMATLVSASAPGERIGVRMSLDQEEKVSITIDRPAALSDYPGESVLGIDDEGGDSSLLGTGFALRLARNLARELGGSLVIEPESLTLRLPASLDHQVGQAHLS